MKKIKMYLINQHCFKRYGVKYVKGKGTIVGPNEVAYETPTGEKSSIKTKNIVIATGSEVTPVPGINVKNLIP